MLRFFVLLVLLANLVFLAWTQDWLPTSLGLPRLDQREPGRVAAQVNPQLVKVVPPKVAAAAKPVAAPVPAPVAAAPACVEAGPFADNEVAAAENLLSQASLPAGSWTREQVARTAPWAVYMGRFSDRDAMRAKEEELRRLKLNFDEVRSPPLLTPGLKLSTHPDKASAEAALVQASQRGVRSARVVELQAPPPQTWLRFAEADADLQSRLKGLGGPGAGFVACRRGNP